MAATNDQQQLVAIGARRGKAAANPVGANSEIEQDDGPISLGVIENNAEVPRLYRFIRKDANLKTEGTIRPHK